MSKEAIADSEVESNDFDMDGAVEEMGRDIFGVTDDPDKEAEEEQEADEDEGIEDDGESDQEEEDDDTDDNGEDDSEEAETALERPQSWKKDMDETWKSMSKEAQEYVLQREEQMKEGLSTNKDDADLGLAIRDVTAPIDHILQQNNVDKKSMVQNLLNGHIQMMQAAPEQKKEMLLNLAKNYGVELGQPVESDENVDPHVKQLQNELQQVKGMLNQQQRMAYENQQYTHKQETDKINQQVNEFAENHDYFDELSDEIAVLVKAGKDLEDAYQIAFRNSEHFEKKLRQETEEKLRKERKEKAEKAKQATSVNVKSRDTGKAPTAPTGSMDDTLRETLRAIKKRESN